MQCFADIRRYSCIQRNSGCDLVRSHKTSMVYCDCCYGRISPGKNIGALGDDDALVATSAFKSRLILCVESKYHAEVAHFEG